MATYFSGLGYTAIKADIEGYSTPDAIWWTNKPQEQKIPDLTCFKNDAEKTFIILEAETCSSLSTDHTQDQWKLFSSSAKKNNGEFHVVVPKVCGEDEGKLLVEKLAEQIGVTVDSIWWPKE